MMLPGTAPPLHWVNIVTSIYGVAPMRCVAPERWDYRTFHCHIIKGISCFRILRFSCAPHGHNQIAQHPIWNCFFFIFTDVVYILCREVTCCVLCIWYLDIVISYHLFVSFRSTYCHGLDAQCAHCKQLYTRQIVPTKYWLQRGSQLSVTLKTNLF